MRFLGQACGSPGLPFAAFDSLGPPCACVTLRSPPCVRAQALLLATAAATTDVTCTDEFDSTQLSEAVDTAMMELQGAKGWFTQLKTTTGYHNALSVNSCTPGPQWKYPAAADAKGLLKRVLETSELRVAGVQWSKGEQADYKTDPENPTGFWCAARHANRERDVLNRPPVVG